MENRFVKVTKLERDREVFGNEREGNVDWERECQSGQMSLDSPFYADNLNLYYQNFQKTEKLKNSKNKKNKKNKIKIENQQKYKQ